MQPQRADRRQNLIAMLLVGVAMILGGGGSPVPLPEMALQVFAALALCVWACSVPLPLFRGARPAWLIAGLMLALPLAQLVPLPPAAWQALPGREAERAALALIGADSTWRPWSVAPSRTLAALLALAVPAVVLLMVASLNRSGRAMAVAMIAGIALLGLLVGVVQMAAGEANTLRFYVPDQPYLNGFQANHNSAADVLLIGMVAFVAALREAVEARRATMSRAWRLAAVGGATALFSLGVFLTASRAGAVLLPVAWLAVVAMIWPWVRLSRRTAWIAVAGLAGALGLAGLLLSTNGMILRVVGRYQFGGEFRPQLWHDAVFAMQQFLPFGSGLGTFVPVFIAAERLEVVDATVPNRAHNDYLELMVEGGVFGWIVLATITAILTRQAWRRLRAPDQTDPGQTGIAPTIFAVAALGIVALHSLVDYPLRSLSLACIAAAAAGLLMPPVHARRAER